jgi:hypothetical protein
MFRNKSREKHLAEISKTLNESEVVKFSAFATIVTKGDLGTDAGAFVVTNKRVVFSGDAPFLGTNSNVSVRLEEIDGVSSGQKLIKGGLIQPFLELNVGGSTYFFNMKPQDSSEAIQAVKNSKASVKPLREDSKSENLIVDQLEKLGSLFERGLLSKEEFENQKRKILD